VTQAGALRRTQDLIVVILMNRSSGEVLVEDFRHQHEDGIHHGGEVTPCVDKSPDESITAAAYRCLREQVGAEEGAFEIIGDKIKAEDSEETSEMYSGLTTIVRKRIVLACVVNTADKKALQAFGIGEMGKTNNFKVARDEKIWRWEWKKVEQVPELVKHCNWLGITTRRTVSRKTTFNRTTTKARHSFSAVEDRLQLALPWTEAEVEILFKEHETDASVFGMSLQELSLEASQGELFFGTRTSDGALVCVRDIVLLQVSSSGGHGVLVEKQHPVISTVNWPAICKSIDESFWDAARRLARTQLGLEEGLLRIQFHPTKVCDGSGHERFQQRKWLLSAFVPSNVEDLCGSIHASEVHASEV